MTIRIGFTGTRLGMSVLQARQVARILDAIKFNRFVNRGVTDDTDDLEEIRGHHGCCEGADLEFGQMCRERGFLVEGHPGPDSVFASTEPQYYTLMHEPLPNLQRNRVIVDGVAAMIAAPPTDDPQPRGGTWWTVRYTEKVKRPLVVVTPSGLILPGDEPWPWPLPVGKV